MAHTIPGSFHKAVDTSEIGYATICIEVKFSGTFGGDEDALTMVEDRPEKF